MTVASYHCIQSARSICNRADISHSFASSVIEGSTAINVYDVAYIVNGGTEKNVEEKFITFNDPDLHKRSALGRCRYEY